MSREPTWFGQPRGLTILFLTNMWEQFSYYGMRALLVYYMTKQLMLGQGSASFIYGAYTACAYFTPIVGGVIADRVLGKRRAIIVGASTARGAQSRGVMAIRLLMAGPAVPRKKTAPRAAPHPTGRSSIPGW